MFMCLEYEERLNKLMDNYELIKNQEIELGKLFECY